MLQHMPYLSTLRGGNGPMSPLVSARFPSIMTAESESHREVPRRMDMRRPAKGATTHPTQARPGMGYGRPVRPSPEPIDRVELTAALHAFLRGDTTEPVSGGRSSVTSSDSLAERS